MGNQQSNGRKRRKPYKDFPLSWHPRGYWCKKIRGKIHYFGSRNGDAQKALDEYLDVRDDLQAGRDPARNRDALKLRDAVNHFLTDRQHRLEADELAQRSFDDYYKTCERILREFGKSRCVETLGPTDFLAFRSKYAKRWGPVTLGNEVQRVRVLFKFLWDSGLVEKPVLYDPSFKRPSRKVLRQARLKKGPKILESDEINRLLSEANSRMKTMILLGVNCGFGNADCATLKETSLDLEIGWVHHPRPKTGIERRCPLWPETIEALLNTLASRPEANSSGVEELVFVTSSGNSWTGGRADNPVTKEFRKLLDKLKLHRPGIGFYALRHVFETIAGECRDQVAVDFIMGHAREDMASVYRERISDDRLINATQHVREWLGYKTVPK